MKERGKYISRAIYQKVVEENRKLLRDIAVMVQEGISAEAILLKIEYRKKFKKQRMFTKLLKEAAQIYFKNNPHLLNNVQNVQVSDTSNKKMNNGNKL